MKGVGNAISAAFGDASAKAGVSGGVSAGKGFGGGLLKTGAIAGAAAAVASKAMNVISGSIGDAVNRVDTLNAFPKVMGNLGYSSTDAAKQVKVMSDRLIGLPTSLDSMTGMVQKIAPLTKNLGEATDISLAFNDALLAGGKSTGEQANAMEQYTQMLSVGKVDMQAWRSVVNAMPGQMNQLAVSLLGAGHNQMDLYDAMKHGKVSFGQFNDAVKKLDKNGVNGFASFAKQAKDATGGIGTSMENVKTAITRSIANIIQSIGAANIAGAINGIGKAIGWLGGGIAAVVGPIANFIGWLGKVGALTPVLAGFAAAIAVALLPAIWGAVTATWAWTVALLANPLTWVALAIGAVVAALVYFFTQTETGKAIWQWFMSWLQAAWTNISVFFQGLWNGIVGFFRSAGTNAQNAWNAVVSWFQGIPGRIIGFFGGIGGAIGGFFQSAANFVGNIWNNVVGFFAGIPGRILGALGNVGSLLWNAGSSIISGLLDGMKSAWNKVTGFVSGIAGWVADHKGPLSYDARLLIPAGNVIMQGFGDSLQKSFRANVVPFVSGVGGQLAGMVGSTGINASMGVAAREYATPTKRYASSSSQAPARSYSPSYTINSNDPDLVVKAIDARDRRNAVAVPID
jgi:tape measure domain-containing protein